MAILKTVCKPSAPHIIKKYVPKVVTLTADEQARRDAMIAAAKVTKLPTVGTPLKARWPGDRDYRSFAPKGIEILNPRLRGVKVRFGAK